MGNAPNAFSSLHKKYQQFATAFRFNFIEKVMFLVVGLKGAGKSTLVKRWVKAGISETRPMTGFVVEEFEWKNIFIRMFEVGGKVEEKRLWSGYFEEVDALIYVVDSSDKSSLALNKQELNLMLKEPLLKRTVFLVMANKQDRLGALSTTELVEGLGLRGLNDKEWSILPISASSGAGVTQAVQMLIAMV